MNIQTQLQKIQEEKKEVESYGIQWDKVDYKSEYALPCGHVRGAYWDEVKLAWCCKVCREPTE